MGLSAERNLVDSQPGIEAGLVYDSLALVAGGSMGAQQTYEWAVRYPDMVKRAAPIAGTGRTPNHGASSCVWQSRHRRTGPESSPSACFFT